MKIISVLFYRKFDYVVFPIGLIALLIIIVDLFFTTKLDTTILWGQFFMVFLYYLATRERAERNFMEKGIQPLIVVSFFGFLVILGFLANVILLMELIVEGRS